MKDHAHKLVLSYMSDSPEEIPIAMKASCSDPECHEIWEFYYRDDDADHRKAAQADALAAALGSHPRLSHLRTFPHLVPTPWEQAALDVLASYASNPAEAGE